MGRVLKRIAAGDLARKALKDNTSYNALEVGHAMTDDVMNEIRKCIAKHNPIFDEEEYCIVRIIADDPLIKNAKRFKYYGWLYLPSPRPNQAVFLYNKAKDTLRRLWVLPDALTMAKLATTKNIVPKAYQTMQAWSVAFYKRTFWEYIRYEHGIDMLSESEYLEANREKLIEAGCKVPDATMTNPFDFSKVTIEKIIDTKDTLTDQDSLDSFGKAQNSDGNVGIHI